MIQKQLIEQSLNKAIEGTDIFVVSVDVTPDNFITIAIDSAEGVDLDRCAAITRSIEADFDRDTEDYQLEVGTAGLTAPFTVKGQYLKNIGNVVDLFTKDGKKLTGTLAEVADDMSEIVVVISQKVKEPGKKRPVTVDTPHQIKVADIRTISYHIDFK